MKRVLAFDFGASSGRAMLATLENGKIDLKEIHRFGNDPVEVNGTLYWDVLRLWFEIRQAITKANAEGGFDSIGIDTWGVDFGLLDEKGQLLMNPVHYRDTRTEGVSDEIFENVISKDDLYMKAGIQYMRFNTIYQLSYLVKEYPWLLEKTAVMLPMPDLFAYFLTGAKRSEFTITSTSNLMDPQKKAWDLELCEKLGIPTHIFPEMIRPGEQYGTLRPELCEELGCDPVPVIAIATHDTASAVVSAPASDKDFVYISCGTWSLFGTENECPVINEASAAANFTNEGGYGGTTRFLKNIMGLWLIQESRRQWIREGEDVTYAMLEKEALVEEPFRSFIDVDDPAFETPGNLPRRVKEYCKKTGQPVPETRGQVMRCIYESLAMKYRLTFLQLQELTGKTYHSIHVVGGGIKDTLLCRLAADAVGAKVLAGPAEATATGNAAVQFISLGELKDLWDARATIARSIDLKVYEPADTASWDAHYARYLQVTGLK
ncbi:MAG: rhamnulokinase [Oscillospiraceae bacterium]|nr:rhamnulokinase [Oscillospiraceae bacterium]